MGSAVQQSKEEPVLHVVDFLHGFCCTIRHNAAQWELPSVVNIGALKEVDV